MVELGAAIALGKPTFLFRDDFRRCTDSDDYPLNLMLFAGLPAFEWQDYFYTSIDEIRSPEKALMRWLGSTNEHLGKVASRRDSTERRDVIPKREV